MSRYILGIHAGHNASVCVGDESGLIYAIQEERLTGEKNYWGFPAHAVQACMDRVGAKARDLEALAYGGQQVICRYHSRDDVMLAYRRQSTITGRLRQQVAIPLMLSIKPDYGQDKLRAHLAEMGLPENVSHYDHHLAHAATAYYGLRTSPDEKYLVVTCDGVGDNISATVRVWGGGQCEKIAETDQGDSLGAIYSWVTFGMGFVPLEHEYKLMGMAPYASESAAEETSKIFRRYLWLRPDGLGFQRGTRHKTNNAYAQMERDLRGMRFDYICAGLQRFTEDLLCEWVQHAVQATGVHKVLAAGGVFMNVKANKRISELDEVESFEAYPSCGDETLSLGAYYLEAAERFGHEAVKPLTHFYLADEAEDEADVLAAIKASGFDFHKPADIADEVARLLAEGHPVARCAGPMEFGARALGNRSILADPRSQDVVRVINRMVKKRDFWMPFAPMVKEERQHDYIQNPKNLRSPFMMMTFDTKENFRDLIAAVHNADLTCRAQILSRSNNPAMHDIVSAFERRTGGGVILNTSFNLHGFPIVRTAEEALGVLRDSGLEYLQVGDFLVHKPLAVGNGTAHKSQTADTRA